MNEAYDWLFHEHSGTEELLRECIEDAEMSSWENCQSNFDILVENLKTHIAMEEEVLFPAYERVKDLPQEPIRALRTEHNEIVRLLHDILIVLKTRDADHVVESMQPLETVLTGHHEKEEDFFLPLAGFFLMPHQSSLEQEMKDFDPTTASREWGF
jgi:hemerythrin-like domain-containing protein